MNLSNYGVKMTPLTAYLFATALAMFASELWSVVA